MKKIKFIFFSFFFFSLNFAFSKEQDDKPKVILNVKPIPSKPVEGFDLCLCAKKWLKKARAEDVVAMTELSRCYAPFVKSMATKEELEVGACVQNADLRASWLGAAASRGFAQAQYEYGILYLFGTGVVADKVNAGNWMVLSAAQDYPPAYFTLGEIYQFGLGRPKDLAKATQCFVKAATLGELRAKDRLQDLKSE